MTLQSVHVGGGSYRNLAETDRRLLNALVGNRYGVLTGFTINPGAGLTMVIAAGEAIVRGKSVTGQGSYYASDTAAATINWPAPAASSRIDALVLAVGDPQYGAVGTGLGAMPGPQWIVVQGTPGSGTPPTDATIQTAVGAGAWERWANVTIAPTDTTIAAGNIARTGGNNLLPTAQPPLLLLARNATQTQPTANVETDVAWDAVEENIGFTVPTLPQSEIPVPRSGVYRIDVKLGTQVGANTLHHIGMRINNVTTDTLFRIVGGTANAPMVGSGGLTRRLVQGDLVEIFLLTSFVSNTPPAPNHGRLAIEWRRD